MERPIATAGSDGLVLGTEQRAALEHIVRPDGLSIIVGYAGTGKSALLGVARDGWEQAGYRVTGLALSGIAAENLESGSGIASRTIASLEHQWGQGRELPTSRDILVVDEAGMIGTRQMERIVREAEKRGAKLVLVGDPEQLQAIEAGAAFRTIAERHGAQEISEVRRQREDWQRDATRHLATGRTAEAIRAYEDAGHIHAAETREAARANLVQRWDRARQAAPSETRVILTHTRDEVAELNQLARERLRASGELGDDVTIGTARGARDFARGDRIMFLRNERSLGVKNGSLGVVESATATRMAVLMDDGRAVAFDAKDYADIDHGYAATIHKSQGVTVDRAHVLATPGLDRHAAYVALSRHRSSVDLHYGQDDFTDQDRLVRTLARERAKDMASDYAIETPPEAPVTTWSRLTGIRPRQEPPLAPEPAQAPNPFAGIRPAGPAMPSATPLDRAVERFGRAIADIERMRGQGYEALPHQQVALDKAARALDTLQPETARDLASAFATTPTLIGEAARGRTAAAIRAMQLETEIRIDTGQRADRFVAEWQRLRTQRDTLSGWEKEARLGRVEFRMETMAKELQRDPQLESLLRNRRIELGLKARASASLSHELQEYLGLSRGRGIGI
jgi:hypothetical protein